METVIASNLQRPSLHALSAEDEIVGLLRKAARGLALLEQSPACPGESIHLIEASRAVHLALVELGAV